MGGRTYVGENPLNSLDGDVDDVILPALEERCVDVVSVGEYQGEGHAELTILLRAMELTYALKAPEAWLAVFHAAMLKRAEQQVSSWPSEGV